MTKRDDFMALAGAMITNGTWVILICNGELPGLAIALAILSLGVALIYRGKKCG